MKVAEVGRALATDMAAPGIGALVAVSGSRTGGPAAAG